MPCLLYEHSRSPRRQALGDQRRARRGSWAAPGHSYLRTGRAQLRGLRPGICSHLAYAARSSGAELHYPRQRSHHRPARHCLFFLSSDDRRLSGGGSYTVARFNLGARPSLLAAAALLTDYILAAAVGISAGVGALISAVPSLQPHTLSFCLGILLMVTIVNLRGLREAGVAFMVPTYLFVGTILIVIGAGLIAVWRSGGHPVPLTPLPPPSPASEAVSYWLLLKVFATGCTALTGVEAVSNGVKAFREPAVKNAQRTLTVIIFILAVLLAGISHLVKALRNRRHSARQARIPEHPLDAHRRCFRQRHFLLPDYHFHPAGPLAFRKHRLCGLPAPVPRHRAEQLSSPCVPLSRTPPGVFLRHRDARLAHGVAADFFRRSHGQIDSAVRRRRVFGFYAVAGRDGRALVQEARPALAKKRVGERHRCFCNRHHRLRRARRKIRGGRLDHAPFYSAVDRVLWLRAAALSRRSHAHGVRRAGAGPARRASHRRCRHRSLEQHYQTRARICRQNQQRNHRHPRGARQTFRATEAGVAALRRDAVPRSRPSASQALDPAFAVPVRHRTDSSVHPRTVRVASTAPHRCGDSGTRRRPLVRIFSSQPARPLARMDAPGPRQ